MMVSSSLQEFLNAVPNYITSILTKKYDNVIIELSDVPVIINDVCSFDDFTFNMFQGNKYIYYSSIKFGDDKVFIPNMMYAKSIMDPRMYDVFETNHIIINADNGNVQKIIDTIVSKVNTYSFRYAAVYFTKGDNEEVIYGHFYVGNQR